MSDLYLAHHGVAHDENPPGRGSGRYGYGTGERPNQHQDSFRDTVKELRKQGLDDKQIAEFFHMSTTDFRSMVTVERAMERSDLVRRAMNYREKHNMSTQAIADKMGIPESTVRNLINPELNRRAEKTLRIAEQIKKDVDEKGFVDVGTQENLYLGISEQQLINVVRYLQMEEGYVVASPRVEQFGTGKKTSVKVIAAPGTPVPDIYNASKEGKVQMVTQLVTFMAEDGEEKEKPIHDPVNLNADRVSVRYNEEGGVNKDGVMEIRPGVQDLSLGASRYAQVRIGVTDGKNKGYLKGMAVYGDPKDFPDGVDIIFNTNKHVGTPKLGDDAVLKKQTDDPKNPFKAAISRQNDWVDEKGKEHKGYVNIVRDEGAWADYNNNLPSQFLGKQPPKLAKQQLDLMYQSKKQEFDDICALDNPVIKRKLLEDFADQCDSDAVHLKAAALPRQGHHVILPVQSLKENEVYAPKFKEGETVVLVRFPHASRAEIPELKVTHKNKEAESFMKDARDAVGINPKVAGQLSGADFDGDTVLVIPNPHTVRGKNGKSEGVIKVEKAIQELRDFEPKEVYRGYPGMKPMTSHQTQVQMGVVSNLITDMTIKGATPEELIPVIRHSMVVIDAEKHKLDWKASEKDNHIEYYKQKYQIHADDPSKYGGAQTLLSRAKSETRVPQRRQYYKIDPDTGEKIFETLPDKLRYYDKVNKKTGKVTTEERKTTSTQMYEATDARELISDKNTTIENIYADFANNMKALGNSARKEFVTAGKIERSPEAAKKYAEQVATLDAKLLRSKKNAPLERQAQLLATKQLNAQKRDNPAMTKADIKKAKNKLLMPARRAVGAHKILIDITDAEWEAIQAGALSDNKVMEIFNNSDSAKIKERATPRERKVISASKKNRMMSLHDRGYTYEQIAEFMGVSQSTVARVVNE